MIKENNKISRKNIAISLGISERTVTKYIKNIPNIKYIRKGKGSYWELSDL